MLQSSFADITSSCRKLADTYKISPGFVRSFLGDRNHGRCSVSMLVRYRGWPHTNCDLTCTNWVWTSLIINGVVSSFKKTSKTSWQRIQKIMSMIDLSLFGKIGEDLNEIWRGRTLEADPPNIPKLWKTHGNSRRMIYISSGFCMSMLIYWHVVVINIKKWCNQTAWPITNCPIGNNRVW